MTKEDIAVRGNVDDDDFARIRKAVEDPRTPASIALDRRDAENEREQQAIIEVLAEASELNAAALKLEARAAQIMAEAKAKGLKYGSAGVLAALGVNRLRGG